MSWSLSLTGRDKEKLKEAVRAEACKDEENHPHSGVPTRVVDYVCKEIDRIRIYEYQGKKYGITISGSGSFHEQGSNETVAINPVRLVE